MAIRLQWQQTFLSKLLHSTLNQCYEKFWVSCSVLHLFLFCLCHCLLWYVHTHNFPELLGSKVQDYFSFILSPTYLNMNYFLISRSNQSFTYLPIREYWKASGSQILIKPTWKTRVESITHVIALESCISNPNQTLLTFSRRKLAFYLYRL